MLRVFSFIIICLTGFYQLNAQVYRYAGSQDNHGITLFQTSADGLQLQFNIREFSLNEVSADELSMKSIAVEGVFLPNNEGAPDLPGFSRLFAIPEGASVTFSARVKGIDTLKNIHLVPALKIPKDTEKTVIKYTKNQAIYSSNAFYPENPFTISEITQIRGVDAAMIGITPFQYNPVTCELIVYHSVEINIRFEGGNGKYGENRLRSRWFDPILEDALMNYSALPEMDYPKITNNTNLKNNGVEYLIVVPDDPAWMPYAEQIKDFRIRQGITTGIVTLSEIGGNTVEALKGYFNNAFNTWDIPPVAVLLMADYGTNPANSIISPLWNFYCVSDNIFADVNDNQLPDIIFARMTASNTSHLQTMVSKMIQYESNPPTDINFYKKPITALGWQTERWFQLCSETVGGYWRKKGKLPVRVNDIFEGFPGSTWSTATNTSTVVNYFGPSGTGYIPSSPATLGGWSGGTAQMVANAVNDGAFALQHRDHGYEYGWGEPGFVNSSINLLNNTQNCEWPFVFSLNCLTGKYNIDDECFTEKFHRYTYNGQNAGALGLIAASEISYSFVNDVYAWGMYDNFYPDFLPNFGPYADERGMLPAFGNAAGKYFLQQSSWPYNTGNKEVTYHLFHHHGDAFQTVYNEVPQPFTIAHDTLIYSYSDHLTVTANSGAFIALTSGDRIIGTALSNGQPAMLSFDPLPSGTPLTLTITKQNFFRYVKNIQVITPEGPYLIVDSVGVMDSLSVFPNGQADFGETIQLVINLKNIGSTQADQTTCQLTTTDPWITIIHDSAYLGNIASGQTISVQGVFEVAISSGIPDSHDVEFQLAISDGNSEWQPDFSITVNAPVLFIKNILIHDNGGNHDGFLDPGETAPILVTLVNNGHSHASGIKGLLVSNDPWLTIENQDTIMFGEIEPLHTEAAWFRVTAHESIPSGYAATAQLQIFGDHELVQQDELIFSFAGYCIPSANCSYGDGIRTFSLNEINNLNNGCSPSGYGNFSALVATVQPGQSCTVKMKGGYSNQKACLWIDFNSNKVFETSEMLIENFTLASSTITYSKDINIPPDVQPGYKRLRLRAQYQNASSDPCSNFSYGETEDYTVYIPDPNLTQQNITLEPGWNSLSAYLDPVDSNLEAVFANISGQLVIVQNPGGVYWPEQSVNTLNFWNPYQGYLIKINSTTTFTVSGAPASPRRVQLSRGWNMMPVLSSAEINISNLFANHLSSLVMVKEPVDSGVYWPQMGIATLQVLQPGKSYYVFVTDNLLIGY